MSRRNRLLAIRSSLHAQRAELALAVDGEATKPLRKLMKSYNALMKSIEALDDARSYPLADEVQS